MRSSRDNSLKRLLFDLGRRLERIDFLAQLFDLDILAVFFAQFFLDGLELFAQKILTLCFVYRFFGFGPDLLSQFE